MYYFTFFTLDVYLLSPSRTNEPSRVLPSRLWGLLASLTPRRPFTTMQLPSTLLAFFLFSTLLVQALPLHPETAQVGILGSSATESAYYPLGVTDSDDSFETDIPEDCLRICDLELSGPACFSAPASDECLCDLVVLMGLEQCLICVELHDSSSDLLLDSMGLARTAAEFMEDYESTCPSIAVLRSINGYDRQRRRRSSKNLVVPTRRD